MAFDNDEVTLHTGIRVRVIDPATGTARALLDGNVITYLRTAAAGAIGVMADGYPTLALLERMRKGS